MNILDLPEFIQSKIHPTPESGCWIWTGWTSIDGYGRVFFVGKYHMAHRFVYELSRMSLIKPGMALDHLCRVRCCVNPAHLEQVTLAENTMRGNGFGAVNARKTHCPLGHQLADGNLRPNQGKRRRCLICRDESNKRSNAKYRKTPKEKAKL